MKGGYSWAILYEPMFPNLFPCHRWSNGQHPGLICRRTEVRISKREIQKQLSHMIASRQLPKTLTYAIEHVTARYSSDRCYCLFKILKFKFFKNLFFDLVVIRSSVLRHVTPIFHFHQQQLYVMQHMTA